MLDEFTENISDIKHLDHRSFVISQFCEIYTKMISFSFAEISGIVGPSLLPDFVAPLELIDPVTLFGSRMDVENATLGDVRCRHDK